MVPRRTCCTIYVTTCGHISNSMLQTAVGLGKQWHSKILEINYCAYHVDTKINTIEIVTFW